MQAGKLRHQVTLQSKVPGRDSDGQPLITWVDFATVWADVRFLNGLETLHADADTALVRASIRVRYLEGVDAAMRVQHDGATYEVRAVLPDVTGRRFIDLSCESVHG